MSGKHQRDCVTLHDRAPLRDLVARCARWRTARFECFEVREMLAVAPSPPLLVDVNTLQSSNPRELTEYAGRLYFVADHEEYGAELFSTDGTAEGTSLVADLKPGKQGSSPSHLVVSGDFLYFVTTTDFKYVWRTDGTAAGTIQVADWYSFLPDQFDMIAADHGVYMSEGFGGSLWKVGSTFGTAIEIGYFDTLNLHDANALTSFRDRLYFIGDNYKIYSARASYRSARSLLSYLRAMARRSPKLCRSLATRSTSSRGEMTAQACGVPMEPPPAPGESRYLERSTLNRYRHAASCFTSSPASPGRSSNFGKVTVRPKARGRWSARFPSLAAS